MKAGSIFSELKETDITDIERKINALLIAEGYTTSGIKEFEGINNIEYRRGVREIVFITTYAPQKKSA